MTNPFKLVRNVREEEANEVHKLFASRGVDILELSPNMAGFAILAWDDDGTTSSVVYMGENNPFAPILIPGIALDHFKNNILNPKVD